MWRIGGKRLDLNEADKDSGRRQKILVVEDDPISMLLVLRALKRDAWQTKTAENGLQAKVLLRAFHPDLVITDLLMPGMDGENLIRQLRGDGFSGPIVLVTAVDLEEIFHPRLTPGVTLEILKPISVSRLRRTVEELLGSTDESPKHDAQ